MRNLLISALKHRSQTLSVFIALTSGIPLIANSPASLANQSGSVKWTPVEQSVESSPKVPVWTQIPAKGRKTEIIWTKIDDDEPNPTTKANNQVATNEVPKSFPHPVTGGVFHIKRNDQFLPAITHFIPSGYGASFGNISTGLWLEDCLTAGGKLCGGSDRNYKNGGQSWIDEFQDWGKGRVVTQIGLGDPNKWLGLDAAFQFTSLSTTRPGQEDKGTPFGSGQGLDLSISRNLTPDWGIKLGARNIAKFDNVQLDSGRSAFLVTTKRFDLGGHPDTNSNDLYVTVGLGNGRMRPLRAIIEDQTRECQKDIDRQGYRSTGPYVVHCLERGFDYGTPWPIASVAYMANEQISFIAEWWGRNLLLGASIKPFEDVNWVISPAVTSIIHNSDWDPEVPGYTERMRFNLSTSIGF